MGNDCLVSHFGPDAQSDLVADAAGLTVITRGPGLTCSARATTPEAMCALLTLVGLSLPPVLWLSELRGEEWTRYDLAGLDPSQWAGWPESYQALAKWATTERHND